MIIHGDGNSNVVADEKYGCFGLRGNDSKKIMSMLF
jgi:hypothetical protein